MCLCKDLFFYLVYIAVSLSGDACFYISSDNSQLFSSNIVPLLSLVFALEFQIDLC